MTCEYSSVDGNVNIPFRMFRLVLKRHVAMDFDWLTFGLIRW